MNQTVILPKNKPRDEAIGRIVHGIHDLPADKVFAVEITERRGTRSLQQNAYLWGVCYPTIMREGGEALAGWTSGDIHEYMLGEWSGWETLSGFGRKRLRPLRRSSKLSKTEFADFVDFIQRTAANLGIVIPDPDSELVT